MFEIAGKKIPSTLAELVDPKRAALLIWDMEYAMGPNAFNYKDILANLQQLSAAARSQTVNTKSSRGAPADANSPQLLLRRPSIGRRFRSSVSRARSCTLPWGWLPALNALKRPLPQ